MCSTSVLRRKKCNLTLKHIKAKTPKYGKPKDDDCDDDSRKIIRTTIWNFYQDFDDPAICWMLKIRIYSTFKIENQHQTLFQISKTYLQIQK